MFDRKSFFIREHVGMFKLTDTYDILDPETQEPIGVAKEQPGALVKILRLIISKQLLPTTVNFYEGEYTPDSAPVLTLKRGVALFRARCTISDGDGKLVGSLLRKMFSLGGAFRVFDAADNEFALVKGDWKGWNFKFIVDGEEIGSVTKKWAGLGKELFTSADNYIIDITGDTEPGDCELLLAAGIAIDTVFKEKG
ncbi:MAG: phospholipid scramblase-related protein [Planctomycetota bacterium]|nr:phospholipid scramblase-related protein [Planctomycetota bacterium]